MKLPSPSMAVALAALAVATAGSATAARSLLTGDDVKNGSLTGADIRPDSLTTRNLSPAVRAGLAPAPGLAGQSGAQGVAGVSGAQGTPGIAGAQGGFDPGKISYVRGVERGANPGGSVDVYAYCPAGAKAIGGGHFFAIIHNETRTGIGRNYKSSAIPDGSGWAIYVANDESTHVRVAAFAVCASP